MKQFWWHQQLQRHKPKGGPVWCLYDWKVNASPWQRPLGDVACVTRAGTAFLAVIYHEDEPGSDVAEHFETMPKAREFVEQVLTELFGPSEFNSR